MGLVNPATEAAKELMPRTLNRKPKTREKDPKNLWITQKTIHRGRGPQPATNGADQQKQAGSRKTQKSFGHLPRNETGHAFGV